MSKKMVTDLLKKSSKIEVEKQFDDGSRWEIKVSGEYQTKMNKTSFEQLVLEKLDGFKNRFDNLENRFDNLENRFDNLENRFDNLENRIDHIEKDVKEIKQDVAMLKSFHEEDIKNYQK